MNAAVPVKWAYEDIANVPALRTLLLAGRCIGVRIGGILIAHSTGHYIQI